MENVNPRPAERSAADLVADFRGHDPALAALAMGALRDRRARVDRVICDGSHRVVRASVEATLRDVPLSWTETHHQQLDRGCIVSHDVILRSTWLQNRIAGSAEARNAPSGSWWSGFAGLGIRAAAAWTRPLAASGTTREARQIDAVRTYVEEFKNKQRFEVFAQLFAPSFRHHFDYQGMEGDMTSWVRTGQDFLRGFPDVRVELRHLFGEGDSVVEINRARGTHRGVFRGVAPTGRPIAWDEIHVYRFEGVRIVENWPAVDIDGIVASLR